MMLMQNYWIEGLGDGDGVLEAGDGAIYADGRGEG